MSSPRPAVSMRSVLRWASRRLLIPAGLALAVGLATFTTTTAADPPSGVRSVTPGKRRDEVVDVYEKVKASVVNIHSERTVNSDVHRGSTQMVKPPSPVAGSKLAPH